MIQRIQSLFLLLAAGASFALFALPFASTDEAVVSSTLFGDGFYNLFDSITLAVFFGLCGALAVIAVFLYKNRRRQMRLTIFAFIANLCGIVFGLVFFMQNSNDTAEKVIRDEFGMYLPILILVLTLLAYRFIGKDQKLVSSMDRLR